MELSLEAIVLWGVPVVLAITLHEAAHGYVARQFGDRTAESLGRVTLNPVRHVDPIGTILVPAVLMLMKAPFLFGWAKPVPVNSANLRHPKRDMIWVAAAGPGSNFAQALAWAFAYAAAIATDSGGFARMAEIGVQVNLVLMALNLLPVPPLDGGRIVAGVLPEAFARAYSRIEPFGLFIIVALLVARVLDDLMLPLVRAAAALIGMILSLFGVPF